jgi:hypothetical protein
MPFSGSAHESILGSAHFCWSSARAANRAAFTSSPLLMNPIATTETRPTVPSKNFEKSHLPGSISASRYSSIQALVQTKVRICAGYKAFSTDPTLFQFRLPQSGIWLNQLVFVLEVDSACEGERGAANVLLKCIVFIQRLMRRRVRLLIADIPVFLG